ncbi:MAG: hypothetical protein H6719_33150 [Sandaracinaceae bacterium]|nr:hypothetical protein [Sandaracinaceae bacterium]
MDEERDPSPPGEGPYRTPPARAGERRWPWTRVAIGAGALATLAVGIAWLWSSDERPSRPGLASVPADLFDDVREWPPPEDELPPSTPLAPLLVADQPQALAVLSPGEGAQRIRRGGAIFVRFNRPMVEARDVGREAESSPLTFEPAVPGVARWTSRSQVSFQPAPEAWRTDVREVQLGFREGLAALSGEPLHDDYERVVVLDGAPRVDSYRSSGRVNAGAALPLYFDAPVSTSSLAQELLAYEVGGGQRSLPIVLSAARNQPEQGYRVDVRLRRALEPGVNVALALAPRYLSWGGGSSPAVMTYELAPRPQIEGIACNEGAAYAGQCGYTSAPGAVIDIGPALRLLASSRLAGASLANFHVRPALRDAAVRLAPHGPPQARLVELSGEWEPDQVYEVRISGLQTEDGEPLRAPPPLAVRSSGHAPQIRVATGHFSFERDATPELAFATIHPEPSDVLYRAVEPGDELRALVSPTPYVREGGASSSLAALAPTARPNRWGSGRYRWRGVEGRDGEMAVVAFRPDPSRLVNAAQTAFVQSTDLGVSVRASREGLLVWVTRLSDAQPVVGASVTVADSVAIEQQTATTDADGVARIALSANPLVVTHAIRVTHGDDRATILLDPRRAVGPSSMGLTPGAAPAEDAPIATVFSDRGAYRPGEGVHAKVVLRRVDGSRVSAVRDGNYLARVFSPSTAAPYRELRITPSRYGTASVDFDLPVSAGLGSWRVEIAREGREEVLGHASLQVAQFRQPTFRVDLTPVRGPVHAGDTIGAEASATYLFGAPVTTGRVSWSLRRTGTRGYPERWSQFRFTPIGGDTSHGTVASGDDAVDAQGRLHIDAQVQLASSTRTRFELEAEVTDRAGNAHASRLEFTAYPAEVEVGLEGGDDWVALGDTLDARAIAIDHAGEPVEGQVVEASFVREGWHSWWEWSESSRTPGGYQLRRDQREQRVHSCRLTSEATPVTCAFAPTRPGTYRLEVQTTDAAGRRSVASRRVYVAGPDEHPDRDPPGAPIAVTPVRRAWTVGETAELAFESPFEHAEALITVEREGVMRVERRSVEAGGQVIRIPVTDAMVPNALIGVTLVKPRDGEPLADVDLHAPDLRYGVAELTVTPATSALAVTIEVEPSARPGSSTPVVVQVRDADGHPVRGEVALWAVDEGTLRLTGYQVPDPSRGLFRAHPAGFAWEDLRRGLVSRVAAPPMPEASGDGNEGEQRPDHLDDRERFDPTPLWAPRLITDDDGRATATIDLPDRPTEYRVMAVAIDSGARSGGASAQLVAEQPIVVRPAFPRFVSAGDRFEASAFVHNATEGPLSVEVFATVGGRRGETRTVEIPAGGEARVVESVTAPGEGPLELRFDARAGDESVAVRDEVGVMPRGRFVRSQVFGASIGPRDVAVGLPEGTPDLGARASITVASHPFVGFEGALEGLEASAWSGSEPLAATLLALVAYGDLGLSDGANAIPDAELEARGRRTARRLIALQNVDGGFGRWSSYNGTLPYETSVAVHALVEAQRRGWVEDEAAVARGVDQLIALTNGAAFGDYYGASGLDQTAFALRVLALAGSPQAARATALYDQRDRLSPYGLAQLAMALGADDSRSDTLVLEASRTVLNDRDDEATNPSALRWLDRSPRVFGAVLEASTAFEVGHPRAGRLAGELLRVRAGRIGLPWGTTMDTARSLRGLAAYARLWDWDASRGPRVTLDGHALTSVSDGRSGATFRVPIAALRGQHTLHIEGGDDGAMFFSIDGRWAVPLTEADEVARGRRTAVHRVYETPDGRPLEAGATVALGEMVRVRVFVYTEGEAPEVVAIHDPIPAGFDAVDGGQDSTPRSSLEALFGTGLDDGAIDARAQHAMRSIHSISHRALNDERASFYFDRLPSGLQEYTYAIRATTVGTFTIPPTQVEALYDPDFVARSTVATLTVAERGADRGQP